MRKICDYANLTTCDMWYIYSYLHPSGKNFRSNILRLAQPNSRYDNRLHHHKSTCGSVSSSPPPTSTSSSSRIRLFASIVRFLALPNFSFVAKNDDYNTPQFVIFAWNEWGSRAGRTTLEYQIYSLSMPVRSTKSTDTHTCTPALIYSIIIIIILYGISNK